MMTGMRLAVLHFLVASVLVLLAFAVCEWFQNVQEWLLPRLAGHLHAIFLPFGAMVLLTWFYGWLALPMMLPAAIVGVGMIVGFSGLSVTLVAVLTAKLATVPLSFTLFQRAGLDARGEGEAANWRVLVAVGLVAALLGNVPRVVAGPCCDGFAMQDRLAAFVTVTSADMGGLMLVLLAAMALFRALRQV